MLNNFLTSLKLSYIILIPFIIAIADIAILSSYNDLLSILSYLLIGLFRNLSQNIVKMSVNTKYKLIDKIFKNTYYAFISKYIKCIYKNESVYIIRSVI